MLPGSPAGTGRLGSSAARPSPANAAAGRQGAAPEGAGQPGAPLPAESPSTGTTLRRDFKPAKPQPKEKDATPLAKALEISSKDFAALEPDADDAVALEDGRRAPRCVAWPAIMKTHKSAVLKRASPGAIVLGIQ